MPSGTCARCGVERRWLHKHHVKFRCDGGTDADGIELLCANCHEDVHDGPMGGKSVAHRRYSPEANARRAEAMRKRWQEPEVLAKMRKRKSRSRNYDYAEIRQMREQGLTREAIAEALGCALGTVHRALVEQGDPGSAAASQQRRRQREGGG